MVSLVGIGYLTSFLVTFQLPLRLPRQSCGRKLWEEGLGLGPVPCVQPQRMDPGTLLQSLAQIYLLPPSPFMVCSPHFSWRTGSFSHLQPSCAPGVRGTVLPGGHMYPLFGGYGIPGRCRELTLVSSVLLPHLLLIAGFANGDGQKSAWWPALLGIVGATHREQDCVLCSSSSPCRTTQGGLYSPSLTSCALPPGPSAPPGPLPSFPISLAPVHSCCSRRH